MSNPDIKKFLLKVATDAQLQEQLRGVTDTPTFTKTMVQLGKSHGFSFSAADVESTINQNKSNPLEELSDEDLALVAGGQPAGGGGKRPPATSDGCGSAWTTLFGPCH